MLDEDEWLASVEVEVEVEDESGVVLLKLNGAGIAGDDHDEGQYLDW